MPATEIHCSPELRARWPAPLATDWRLSYPHLFDDDDLRLTRRQPRYHFFEWLTAVHLFHRDGVHALLAKYAYTNHPRKGQVLRQLLSESECTFLRDMKPIAHVQPPDLLVYLPNSTRYWFVEVKGPRDRLSPRQIQSHKDILSHLGVPVELVEIRLRPRRPRPG